MSQYDHDLFAIGAGSGGVRASRVASSLGARVAVAEDTYPGGTCVKAGCVPKKLFVDASRYREDFEDAAAYGGSVGDQRRFDWRKPVENKNAEIQRRNQGAVRCEDRHSPDRCGGVRDDAGESPGPGVCVKQIWIPRAGQTGVLVLREAEARHEIRDRNDLGEVLRTP